MAMQRTERFAEGYNRLIIFAGTPTKRGVSRLEGGWNESDQRRFLVPCLRCREFHPIEWKDIRWRENDPETAHLSCPSCSMQIGDGERLEMVRQGEWRAEGEFNGTAGFAVWEAYATLRLSRLVGDFLERRKRREALQTFFQQKVGQLTENVEGESPDWLPIRTRAEASYERIDSPDFKALPAGALFLTAGVDSQNDRLAVIIRGWGRGEESWLLHWGELPGDPMEEQVWRDLDALLNRAFPHPSGVSLYVQSYAVDTGGGRTQAVYDRMRQRTPRGMAIKGSNQRAAAVLAGAPTWQDISFNGRKIERGVLLWSLGVHTAKCELYGRLKLETPGVRYMHTPHGLPDSYYQGLTAEKLVTRFHKGQAIEEWVLPDHARNEPLDCEVYGYAAAVRVGLQRMDWDALEAAIAAEAGRAPATSSAPDAPRREAAPPQQQPHEDEGGGEVLRSNWMASIPRR